MVIVLTSLNNLKLEVNDLAVGKLKTLPIELKIFSDSGEQVVKNKNCNTLKTKVNNLEKKIPDVTTLIHINHI